MAFKKHGDVESFALSFANVLEQMRTKGALDLEEGPAKSTFEMTVSLIIEILDEIEWED